MQRSSVFYESVASCPLTLGGGPGVLVRRYFQLCRREAVKPSNLATSSKFPAVYMLKSVHALRNCIIWAEINHLSVALQLRELMVLYLLTVTAVCLSSQSTLSHSTFSYLSCDGCRSHGHTDRGENCLRTLKQWDSFCLGLLMQTEALRWGWSLIQEVLPIVCKIYSFIS
jgi:hypothetical protein